MDTLNIKAVVLLLWTFFINHAAGRCSDVLSNCAEYNKTTCLSPAYRWWAEDQCPKYCGHCENVDRLNKCKDNIKSCSSFRERCFDPKYESWVRSNCARYCEVCIRRPCRDNEKSCHQRADVCTQRRQRHLAESNCRATCRLCTEVRAEPCTHREYLRDFPCKNSLFSDKREIGKCVWVREDPVTWFQAKEECQRVGGWLIKMMDASEKLTGVEPSSTHWIGLNDIESEGVFTWATGSQDEKRSGLPEQAYRLNSSAANWKPGFPAKFKTRSCATMEGNAQWRDRGCEEKFGFICEMTSGFKNLPPRIEIQFNVQPNIVFLGSKFILNCFGFVGHGGEIEWESEGKLNKTPTTLHEEKVYRLDEGRCDVYHNLSLSVTAVPRLTWLRCCTRHPDRSYHRSCSARQDIRILKHHSEPMLSLTFHKAASVVYAHHPIQGECDPGTVADGTLMVIRVSSRDNVVQARYDVTKTSTRPVGQNSSRLMEVNVHPVHTKRGNILRAYFKICPTGILRGATVSCGISSARGRSWLSDVSKPLQPIFVPREPRLLVHYHRQPNVVGINRVLNARCVASVGTDGVLVWKLHTAATTHTWRIPLSETDDPDIRGFPGVTIESKKGASLESGPFIDSTLAVRIAAKHLGAKLQCLSYDETAKPAETVGYDLDVQRGANSRVFDIKDLPGAPMATVRSETQSDGSGVLWTLKGYCWADVEKGGKLRWLVKTDHWAVMWSLQLDGLVEFANFTNTGRNVPYPFKYRDFKQAEPPQPGQLRLGATFEVRLHGDVLQAVAVCYADDQPNCTRLVRGEEARLAMKYVSYDMDPAFAIPLKAVVVSVLVLQVLFLAIYTFREAMRYLKLQTLPAQPRKNVKFRK